MEMASSGCRGAGDSSRLSGTGTDPGGTHTVKTAVLSGSTGATSIDTLYFRIKSVRQPG